MNNESLYDFVPDNFKAPTVASNAAVEKEVITPHQNRADLSKPYAGTFAQKAKEATTDSAPKTSAATEFWRMYTGQPSNNHIAIKINSQFNGQTMTDFHGEQDRYFDLYNKELMK